MADGLLLAGIYSIMVLLVVVVLNLPSYYPENIKLIMLMFIMLITIASTGALLFSGRKK